jgi:hypothetical protein
MNRSLLCPNIDTNEMRSPGWASMEQIVGSEEHGRKRQPGAGRSVKLDTVAVARQQGPGLRGPDRDRELPLEK